MFKVNFTDTRRTSVMLFQNFIVHFGNISYLFLVFLFLTLNTYILVGQSLRSKLHNAVVSIKTSLVVMTSYRNVVRVWDFILIQSFNQTFPCSLIYFLLLIILYVKEVLQTIFMTLLIVLIQLTTRFSYYVPGAC